jgi:hypothetical protein
MMLMAACMIAMTVQMGLLLATQHQMTTQMQQEFARFQVEVVEPSKTIFQRVAAAPLPTVVFGSTITFENATSIQRDIALALQPGGRVQLMWNAFERLLRRMG